MIGIAKLAANLKPKDSILLIKILKGIENTREKRLFNKDISHTHTAMPNNTNNLKQYCTKNTSSIIQNALVLKCANYRCIVNILADEPMKFGLLIELPITMIDLCNAGGNVSKMTNNILGWNKGLQKKL